MFMFVLNILCHNLLDTNRPGGWVQTGRSGNETSEPGYESSGKKDPGVRNDWYETTGNLLTWY